MILLVPADSLRPRRVDDHFAAEAEAARALGIDVALVDHDRLARRGGAEEAVRRVHAEGVAVYRGWMVRSERYAEFAGALRRRNIVLCTTPEQYRRAHEMPGWYAELSALTPRSVWTIGTARPEFDRALQRLGAGPAVLRDYSKSMKHYWNDAAFIPETGDGAAAWRVANRFRELRGADLTGGFVLRTYEPFVSAEIRTWWIGGRCHLIGPHPDSPQDTPPPDFDAAVAQQPIRDLGLPFVTADFALRAGGTWRLIELGDGQVSDRPRTIPPETLVEALRDGFAPVSPAGAASVDQ
ncbi:ATP-grasp domain-containing protein [Nocardia speluncae]|uniref:ATP-grasp domain-containing protein n=1 Tax=Nocardia speluncae TaxID=419477 RepID=A0A846X8Y0_9NOCA|nr:ATP-grasp domain-containing protein [Nocardia speluncae]NKY31927.1 ATP-grasp domain-containing protein [Nocardia speluncae]